jgi:D-arabinose 5-phosphate isomerase GutQ
MLKEIHEQPARIVDTLRGRILPAEQRVNLDEIGLPAEWLRTVNRVVILACGTSYHAGMVGRYAIERLARVPVDIELASEFRYREPVLDEHTLAIAISQSGETADTLAAIREARRLGARSLAICNVMESTIARESGHVLYTHAGPEIGVASTKAFTTQLAALYLVAIWLARHRGVLDAAGEARLTEELRVSSPQTWQRPAEGRRPGRVQAGLQLSGRVALPRFQELVRGVGSLAGVRLAPVSAEADPAEAERLRRDLLRAAFRDALAQAGEVAAVIGRPLLSPLEVQLEGGGPPIALRAAAAPAADGVPPFDPGELEPPLSRLSLLVRFCAR